VWHNFQSVEIDISKRKKKWLAAYPPPLVGIAQGDQIGRIFDQWAIVYLGSFLCYFFPKYIGIMS
jgi:hypothetical protein